MTFSLSSSTWNLTRLTAAGTLAYGRARGGWAERPVTRTCGPGRATSMGENAALNRASKVASQGMTESGLARMGLALADWSERWFPDAFVFAMLAVVVVATGSLAIGAPPRAVMLQFGKGFWDLIPFTMQMALIIVGGYVVASSPPALARIPGVTPFTETIFLWQGLATALILLVVSVAIAYFGAPSDAAARPAESFGVVLDPIRNDLEPRERPGEWLEYSPLLTILIAIPAAGWLASTFTSQGPMTAIANLNTYNFIFLMAGLLLHWRPRRFFQAVGGGLAPPPGVLVHVPFFPGIPAVPPRAQG